jgi:hypothetical protein
MPLLHFIILMNNARPIPRSARADQLAPVQDENANTVLKDQFASNTFGHPAVRRGLLAGHSAQGLGETSEHVPSSQCQTAHATPPPGRRCEDRSSLRMSFVREVVRSSGREIGDAAGGARRDRTDDLMLAKHALSQLSYGPTRRRRVCLWLGLRRQARRPVGLAARRGVLAQCWSPKAKGFGPGRPAAAHFCAIAKAADAAAGA